MVKPYQSLYKNVTETDLQLASLYYPILIESAKQKRNLTYSQLEEIAQSNYPEVAVVRNAIATNTGRRLDVVRKFTSERDLPDITSLVVNKVTGRPGDTFIDNFDYKQALEEVLNFDWEAVEADFKGFIQTTEASKKPRKTIKEPEAKEMMYAYWKNHQKEMPASVKEQVKRILELLMEGLSPEQAFDEVINDIKS